MHLIPLALPDHILVFSLVISIADNITHGDCIDCIVRFLTGQCTVVNFTPYIPMFMRKIMHKLVMHLIKFFKPRFTALFIQHTLWRNIRNKYYNKLNFCKYLIFLFVLNL